MCQFFTYATVTTYRQKTCIVEQLYPAELHLIYLIEVQFAVLLIPFSLKFNFSELHGIVAVSLVYYIMLAHNRTVALCLYEHLCHDDGEGKR